MNLRDTRSPLFILLVVIGAMAATLLVIAFPPLLVAVGVGVVGYFTVAAVALLVRSVRSGREG